MQHFRISKRKTGIAIIISCLLHFGLLLLVFMQSISQWDKTAIPMHDEQDPETYLANQLLSAGQQQPAQVIFQDDAASGDASEPTPDTPDDQEMEAVDQPYKTQTPPPEEKVEASNHEEAPTTFQDPQPAQQVVEQSAEQPKPERKKTKQQKKRTNKKQAMTMADVSRGFMQSMQQEAGHNAASKNMKELSLQVYTSKVWNLIKNAFLASDTNLHLPEAVSAHTQLTLTIDRSGKLLDIHLDYPKHIKALRNIERMLISRAHQAGLFPPLPKNIKGRTKTFSFPLYIQGESGFHSYSLGYR